MKTSRARIHRIRFLAGLLACACVFVAEFWPPSLLARFDNDLKDFLLRIMADSSPEERLVVVDIDDDSIARLGPWPWPRGRIADLTELLLTDYQARAVGLDIVFPEARDTEGDLRLSVLAEYAPVALAQVFDSTPRYPNLALGLPVASPPVPAAAGMRAFGYIANHPALRRARCVGNIGYQPDPDGVLRHIPWSVHHADRNYPHFAAVLLGCAATPPVDLAFPFAEDGKPWRIPFRRALEAYIVLPAAAILRQELPPELVSGRFVVIGSSSLGQGDRVSIPLAPLVSGVTVHAQSISALLDLAEGRARPPWNARPLLFLWTLATVVAWIFLMARLSVWRGMLLLLCWAVAWMLLAGWGFLYQAEGSLLAPLLGYFLLLVTIVPYEWRQAQKRGRRTRKTLSHYVAQPVLEEMERQGQMYSLVPTLREVTVLIADMEGYTRLTSALSLEDAARLTRDFLGCLTRPVLENGGTLDRYSGDGMVAFWGAPFDCPDHADRAVDAALRIQQEIRALNREQARRNLPVIRARIGIESGQALVGDLGTEFRSTYTAVGDCINFASRLESAARNQPFSLVIGAEANTRLRRHATLFAGSIRLRDTDTVIRIYTLPEGSEDREERR
ncbi:MAG: adenylate/guanylate cyclase domain-containing protein [Candidatus Accumulibacter sp.]|jgi:adenylate cyclase|nr:adenylate/guanylate cyclase domain-containing protein [Accumulibacter sp.]